MTLKILLRVSVKRSSIGDYFVNFFIFADNVKCREVSRFRYLPSIYPRITMFLDSPAIKRDTRAVPTSPFIVRLRDFSTNLCSHVSWLIGIYICIYFWLGHYAVTRPRGENEFAKMSRQSPLSDIPSVLVQNSSSGLRVDVYESQQNLVPPMCTCA